MLKQDLAQSIKARSPNNKIKSLKTAIEVVEDLTYQLNTAGLVVNVRNPSNHANRLNLSNLKLPIGKSVKERIQDFLPKSIDSELGLSPERKKQLIKDLCVHEGLSRGRAEKLIKAGLQNKDEITHPKYMNMLPVGLQSNIQYAAHLRRPITRTQVETIADCIRASLPSKYEVIPIGSYRRGAKNPSCVRILIISSDYKSVMDPSRPPKGYFQPLRKDKKLIMPKRDMPLHKHVVPVLEERGLAVSARTGDGYTWNGIMRVPERKEGGQWESLEARHQAIEMNEGEYVLARIVMVPTRSRGAAVLYHTGSKGFGRLIKHKAKTQGLYFSPLGLWRWHPDPSEMEAQPLGDKGPWGVSDLKKRLGYDHDEDDFDDDDDDDDDEDDEEMGKKKSTKKKQFQKTVENTLLRNKVGSLERAEGFWQLLPGEDEESVFDQLGLDYVPPEKRA
ncbi:hypothetical protein H0H93_009799 [Arthromyces matolae]|nr:hypothetical protein H0H93_009799 [Arthromyces matolae]